MNAESDSQQSLNARKRESLLASKRRWYQKHKESIAKNGKIFREENRERLSEERKRRRLLNVEKVRARVNAYNAANREKIRENKKRWRRANWTTVYAKLKAWRKRTNWGSKNYHDRKKNPAFRVKKALKARMQEAFKRCSVMKLATSINLFGTDFETVRKHIESKWKPGMSWENYGRTGWHIDHLAPIASFDLTKEIEQKRCFHFTNLQPLWAIENLLKGDRVPTQSEIRLEA